MDLYFDLTFRNCFSRFLGALARTFAVSCPYAVFISYSLAELIGVYCYHCLKVDWDRVQVGHTCDWWWRYSKCMKAARKSAKRAGDPNWQDAKCQACFGDDRYEYNSFIADLALELQNH